MLKRENRADSSDITALGRGMVVRTPHLLFSYATNPSGPSLIAVSVAKKVAKRAVDRNRLKRQCRAAARATLPTLPHPILGILRLTNARVSYLELEQEVADIFEHRVK